MHCSQNRMSLRISREELLFEIHYGSISDCIFFDFINYISDRRIYVRDWRIHPLSWLRAFDV